MIAKSVIVVVCYWNIYMYGDQMRPICPPHVNSQVVALTRVRASSVRRSPRNRLLELDYHTAPVFKDPPDVCQFCTSRCQPCLVGIFHDSLL